MKNRPFVFVGSSAEGIEVAKAVQANLEYVCESQIWSQGLFGLGEGTLEVLVRSLDHFDFAILVLTGDDLTRSRGAEQKSPRDNVLFELGLFIGGLGKDRVFVIVDRTAKIKLPSDMAGITPASFEPPSSGNMQSAVGSACTAIEQAIRKHGRRRGCNIAARWWTGCLDDGVSENPDFFMTVNNLSNSDLPWLNVHVFPSNTFQLEPRMNRSERFMAGQYATYEFRILETDGQLTKWAKHFSEQRREEVSIRIFKDRSGDAPVLIDFDLGAQLYDRIQRFKYHVS